VYTRCIAPESAGLKACGEKFKSEEHHASSAKAALILGHLQHDESRALSKPDIHHKQVRYELLISGGVTMQISDEHLRGRTVIAAEGQAIGEVAALYIDTSTWMIVSLQVKLSKSAAEQLGAARSLLRAATFELPVRVVQSVGDAVLLSIPTLELRQILPQAADRAES
jgi:sporulation protein YlmC with PRC-barrel domain